MKVFGYWLLAMLVLAAPHLAVDAAILVAVGLSGWIALGVLWRWLDTFDHEDEENHPATH